MNNHIFIVGCPRSGTTFTGRLLGSAANTLYWEESNVIIEIMRGHYENQDAVERLLRFASMSNRLRPHEYPNSSFNLFHDFLNHGLAIDEPFKAFAGLQDWELLDSLLNYSDAKTWVEKSPEHTLCIPTIKARFTNSKILHVTRHPLDVIASLKEFGLRNFGIFDATIAARQWNEYFDIGCLNSDDSIRYEDLTYSKVIAQQFVERSGLNWTNGCDQMYSLLRPANLHNWLERLTKKEAWEASQAIQWDSASKARYAPWGAI